MSDLNKEALAIWESLKPAVDKEIERKTAGTVQRRKVVVSTTPSSLTGLVGVQEPFGVEFFVPYRTEVAAATVGDPVWIEFAYGANNAVAIGMASLVDTGTQTFDDVTITGTLDITPRRCYADTLSSAGWYRIMTFANSNATYNQGATGFEVDFHIGRRRTNSREEIHDIKMLCVYDGVKFVNETSAVFDTAYFRIDKIRYTYSSTNGYVDVHIIAECPRIRADFDVHCEPGFMSSFTSNDFVAVADSPAGETVLTTYNFAANTEQYSSGTSSGVQYVIHRSGKLVELRIESAGGKSCTQGQYTTVYSLPDWAKPHDTVYTAVDTYGGNNVICCMITNGNVQIYPVNSSTAYFRFTVTYFVTL